MRYMYKCKIHVAPDLDSADRIKNLAIYMYMYMYVCVKFNDECHRHACMYYNYDTIFCGDLSLAIL